MFWGGFSFFWSIFSHFFGFFSCKTFFHAKLQLFSGLGGLFEQKKYIFVDAKLQVLRGWVLFLVHFLIFFCLFCS